MVWSSNPKPDESGIHPSPHPPCHISLVVDDLNFDVGCSKLNALLCDGHSAGHDQGLRAQHAVVSMSMSMFLFLERLLHGLGKEQGFLLCRWRQGRGTRSIVRRLAEREQELGSIHLLGLVIAAGAVRKGLAACLWVYRGKDSMAMQSLIVSRG